MSEAQNKDRRRIEAYRKELDGDPKSLVFVALAEALNRLGDFDEAAEVAQRGLQTHRDSVAGRLALAVAEAGRDNIRDALEQIKAALIIDQDNPRALALMGSLLLDKGLARRAVQFLAQAVKLAPQARDYADLLRRAKRLAKDEAPVELPVVHAANVPSGNPWTEDGTDDGVPQGSEHTVFDPDSVKKRRSRGHRSSEPEARLPADAELTHFAGPIDRVPSDPGEKRTAFSARVPELDGAKGGRTRKKPKMGGSAAEYSQVIREPPADGATPKDVSEEFTVAAPRDSFLDSAGADAFSSQPGADDGASPRSLEVLETDAALAGRSPVLAPSVRRERAADDPEEAGPAGIQATGTLLDRPGVTAEVPNAEASRPAPQKTKSKSRSPESKPDDNNEDAAKNKSEVGASVAPPAKKKPSASKQIKDAALKGPKPPTAADVVGGAGKPSTMFVDDAVWAIYGSEPPAADEGGGKKAKKKPAAKPASPQVRRRSVLVVRTSAWFGAAAGWVALALVAGATAWAAYGVSIGGAGAATTESEEQLRSIAADMERGGLASMMTAEESIEALMPLVPTLQPLLSGALAEVYAVRWASFGRDATIRDKARQALSGASAEPSVERITASVVLSTGAVDLANHDATLAAILKPYPRSAKAWVLRAQIAERTGKSEEAVRALYRARAMHPTRRATLMALARWHAKRRAYGSAIAYYDELLLQPAFSEDVEAALERYVVGRLAAHDPGANEVEARLAGLVREELATVAKDEAGRVALLFAFSAFARGDVAAGVEHASKAEGAFEGSIPFRASVGDLLFGAGEWSRAKEQYERVLKLDPGAERFRVAIARASFGEQAKLRPAASDSVVPARGTAELPFGRATLVVDRFTMFEFEPDAQRFPELAYAQALEAHSGAELERQLAAVNLYARARLARRKGKTKAAIELLVEARQQADSAAIEIALGNAHLAAKSIEAAKRAFERALELAPKSVAARVGLGRALAAKGETIDAIEVLEPIATRDMIAPEAFRILASLKAERGDDEGAIALLKRALEVGPVDASLLLEIGRRRHSLDKPDEALAAYRRALEVNGKLAAVPSRRASRSKVQDTRSGLDLYYIGRVMLDRDERTAAKILAAAIRLDGCPVEAQFYFGKTLVKRKRTRRAGRRALQAFKKAAPDSALASQADRLLKGR